MKKIIILTILFCIYQHSIAQMFIKTYGGNEQDMGHSVEQTNDGGYIVVGETISYGDDSKDILLIKTDNKGEVSWIKTYGGTETDIGYEVKQTNDGGYIVVGETESYGTGYSDIYLIKTNSVGDIVWHYTYGGTGYDRGYSVQQTTDGGYIIVGYYALQESPYNDYVYLIKINSSGNLEWQYLYISIAGSTYGKSVQQTSDGGYVIVGYTSNEGLSGSTDIYLLKVDNVGNLLWYYNYGDVYEDDKGYSVQQTTDGGYIITGSTEIDNYNNENVYLLKTNSVGEIAWEKNFGTNNFFEGGYSVQQTTDGSYIITGYAGYDTYLLKINNAGGLLWDNTFGEEDKNVGKCVRQTNDGGYIITGYARSSWDAQYNILLIKTNDNGIATCEIPTNLSASYITLNSAVLGWNKILGVSNYNLKYKKQNSSTWTNKVTSNNTYNLSNLESNTGYEFQIQSNYGDGIVSDWSNNFSFYTSSDAFISEIGFSNINIFPNPTKDKIYISIGENYSNLKDYTIKIINNVGQTVFEKLCTQQLFEIDVTSFGAEGLYFIQILDKNSKIINVRKIVSY